MENLVVTNINDQLVIDSRQVAKYTEKRHSDLLRDIENFSRYLENAKMRSQDFFIESDFKTEGNNKTYKCYLLTKKGCDMVANKMTGQKGVLFTAAYVTRFEEMENELKGQDNLGHLSPELQVLINMELKQKELETAVTENKQEIQDMRDVISLDTTSWRTEGRDIIVKIAGVLGGVEYIREVNKEIYALLNARFGVKLEQRLTNKRRRMADEGVCKSSRNKVNRLDVIAEDKKLIEGYVAIVKEMAIKYKVA